MKTTHHSTLRYSVLIAENKKENLVSIKKLLRESGLDVITSCSGYSTNRSAVSKSPALIIIGSEIKDTDRFTLCSRLKTDSRTSSIPVLMIISNKDKKARTLSYQSGADDIIHSPLHREEFLARIKNMVSIGKRQEKAANDKNNAELIPAEGHKSTGTRGTTEPASVAFYQNDTLLPGLLSVFPVPVFYKDANGRYIDVNESFITTFGYQREQVIGKTVFDIYPRELAEFYDQKDKELFESGGSQSYEGRFSDPQGREHDVWTHKAIIRNEHREAVGLIGTIIDITERNRYRLSLNAQKEEFEMLFNLVPAQIWYKDTMNGFIRVNEKVCADTGFSHQQIEGHTAEELFPAFARQYFEDDKEVFVSGKPKMGIQEQINTVSGELRWLQTNKIPVYDAAGRIKGLIAFVQDLTDLKKTTEVLRESQEELEEAQSIAHIGSWEFDVSTGKPKWSKEMFNIFRLDPALGPPSWPEHRPLIHPDDWKKVDAAIQAAIHHGIPYSMEFRIALDNQKIAWAWTIGKVIHDSNGKVIRLHGTVQDITERKQTEEQLRESEDKYRSIFENSNIGILLTSPDGSILSANKYICDMLGMTEEEICKKGRNGIVDMNDPQLSAMLSERSKTGIARGELRMLKKDGKAVDCEVSSVLFTDKDGNLKTSMIIQDLTEKKKAEEALQASEKNYREIFNAVNESIYIHDAESGKIIDVNDSVIRSHGYDDKEDLFQHLDTFWTDIRPYAKENAIKMMQKALHEGPQTFEWLGKMKNGELIWNEVSLKKTEIGGRGRILAVVRDITERKLAEEAMQKTRERWQSLFENSPSGIAIYKAVDEGNDFMFTEFNPAAQKIEQVNAAEVIGKRVSEVFPVSERMGLLNLFKKVNETGQTEYHRSYFKDEKREGWRENVIFRLNTGEIVAIYDDISERMQAEISLRESEEKFRNLFQSQSLINLLIDPETGEIADANEAASKYYGWTTDELKQMKIQQINTLPSPEVRHVMQSVDEHKQSYFEFRHRKKNGTEADIEAFSSKLRIRGKVYLHTVIHDISQRKFAEEALQKSRERWESLFHNSPSAIAVYQAVDEGKDFIFTDFNLTAQKSDRIERDKVIGKRITELFPSAEEMGFLNNFREVWKTGKTKNMGVTHYKDDRIEGWRENIIYRLNTGEVVAIYNDVSKREEAELKLRQSEQKFKSLYENAADPIMLLNFDGKIIDVNPAACHILGYTSDELRKMNVVDLNAGEYKHKVKTRLNTLLREDRLFFETAHFSKDGSLLQFEINSKVIEFEGKRVILSIYRDVTEKKKNEIALRESEEKFRRIFENHAAVKMLIDADNGNIADANEAAAKYYGWTRDELKQMNLLDLNMSSGNLIKDRIQLIRTGEQTRFELKHRLRNGAVRDVETYSSIVDISGKLLLHSIIHDITESKRAGLALRESELFFKESQKAAFIGSYKFDIVNNHWNSSEVLDEIMGIPESYDRSLEGWLNLIHPDDRNMMDHYFIHEVLDQKKSFNKEYRIIRQSDQGIRWVLGLGNLSMDENGNVIVMTGTIQDVTERRRIQEIIARNEQRLSIVINNTTDMLTLLKVEPDKTFTYETVNKTYLLAGQSQYYNLSENDFIGRNAEDVMREVLKFDAETVQQEILQLLKVADSGIPENYERIIPTPAGKVYLETNLIPVLNADGECTHILWSSRDITERRTNEIALHESNSMNESLLLTIPFGMDIVDEEGTVVFISDKLAETVGNDALNKKCWQVYRDDQKQCSDCPLHHPIELGKTEVYETDGILGGRTFQISRTGMLFKGRKAILKIFQDITERKQGEKELLLAKEKAEESDRLKTAFLHNISHEIRTPMNAIMGFSGLLNNPDLAPEKRMHFTDLIIQSSEQLLSIITDIISIATIDAEQEKLYEKEFSIHAVIGLVYDQFASRAEKQNLELSYHMPLPNELDIIKSDRTKLESILVNLVGNALKFTHQGHVKFGYTLKGDFLEFFVEDSGIGIPAHLHKEIFKRFRQVEIAASRQYGGSGLGLSISKAYVQLMGGNIWLISEPGNGSTFYFTIPYRKAVFEAPSTSTPLIPADELSLEKKTILIAEDEDSNYLLIEEMLSDTGYNIIRVVDGNQAVEACRSGKEIDLVLMDIKMPGMDGLEATRQIKSFRPGLPVIAQSAYSFPEEKKTALDAGCDAFISKPVKSVELMHTIDRFIHKNEK